MRSRLGIVTREMLSVPKWRFPIIGFLEALGVATGMAAAGIYPFYSLRARHGGNFNIFANCKVTYQVIGLSLAAMLPGPVIPILNQVFRFSFSLGGGEYLNSCLFMFGRRFWCGSCFLPFLFWAGGFRLTKFLVACLWLWALW